VGANPVGELRERLRSANCGRRIPSPTGSDGPPPAAAGACGEATGVHWFAVLTFLGNSNRLWLGHRHPHRQRRVDVALGIIYRTRMRHRKDFNDPGDAHELTFSCYKRFSFLKADRTCQWLKEAIDVARAKLDFALRAYVFMPEHVHLIICPRQPIYDVAAIRKALKEPVGCRAMAYLTQCTRPIGCPK
jgi:hypothetical protein